MEISMRRDISVNPATLRLTIHHLGWLVRLEHRGKRIGRSYVTAVFTPLDPLSRDKAILKDLLSHADYMDYMKIAGSYVSSLDLPHEQRHEFPAGHMLMLKPARLRGKIFRKILAKAKDYAETHLPAIGPVDIDCYLDYLTAGGITSEAISVIRLINAGYPSGNISE